MVQDKEVNALTTSAVVVASVMANRQQSTGAAPRKNYTATEFIDPILVQNKVIYWTIFSPKIGPLLVQNQTVKP
ncbi:MAG: hypothetical protein ABSA79_02640 [Candidatus Bathyarchaeia archaeon]